MKILLLTIGKTKARFFYDAIEQYCESIHRMNPLEYVELKDQRNDPKKEMLAFVQALKKRNLLMGKHKIFLLDVLGKEHNSESFAELLEKCRESSYRSVTFIVGGAFGLHPNISKTIPEAAKLSLSPLTFPHELARVVLLEQIYRALHIQAKTPYHHK